MQIRGAAIIGLALVIVHLIMHACLWTSNLVQMMAAMRHWPDLMWLVSALAHLTASVILDVALLIVLGCLARTQEKLVRDRRHY